MWLGKSLKWRHRRRSTRELPWIGLAVARAPRLYASSPCTPSPSRKERRVPPPTLDKQTMEVKAPAISTPTETPTATVCKEATLAGCHRGDDKGKDRSSTNLVEYLWDPSVHSIPLDTFDLRKVDEMIKRRYSLVAKSLPNDIIVPDPTPKWVRDSFFKVSPCLESILKKDSVRCFLRLFAESTWSMSWNFNISSETLTCMIKHDALRCTRVVLEGKTPKLGFMHANPNCMNPYGYFPLHEAAERFSVDMIKLLFRYGASANVRTSGGNVTEGLLPLHVAVGNTCLHKYLQDNLFPIEDHQDYVYNLIHLLCLPEMKIFLDTTRLLAAKTNNLVDEVWNYIKTDKLVEATVLLLAAQREIRKACISKGNVNGKHNGFYVIMYRISKYSMSLRRLKHDSEVAQKQVQEKRSLVDRAWLVVRIITHAGEALDKYIQAHSEVPQVEVLEHVSSILKEYGFCPKGKCFDVTNLRPYDCNISDGKLDEKDGSITSTEASYVHAAVEKAVKKKILRGWDPTYTRRSYFPYWRSVLGAQCNVRVYPSYAAAAANQHRGYCSNSIGKGSTSLQSCVSFSGRIQQLTNNHQSRRFLRTGASTLLKMLKMA